jgi:hypothetical protein
MKLSINKDSEKYLEYLEREEKKSESFSSEEHIQSPDPIDLLIKNNKLQIVGIHFHQDLDLMLIVLNNTKIIKRKISDFEKLKKANSNDLEAYSLSRYGIHWDNLDEDLSLRGFLQYEISHIDMRLFV